MDEVASPRQEYNIQRQGARVRLRSGITGTLHLSDVTLLNISRSGVLLEHFHQVRVGELYQLAFPAHGRRIAVSTRAVRSCVSRFAPLAGGEKQTVYHTGLEFTGLTEDMVKLISGYIERLRSSGLNS